MSMCIILSCTVGIGCLLWPVGSFGKTVSLCPASSCTPRPSLPVTPVSLEFLHLHSSPLWWKGHLFWVLVLEGLVGLHRTVQIQLLQHYCWDPRLGLLWYWMICLGNKPRSFYHFETAPKYCILDCCWLWELYKKDFHDPDNHDGVITHLEPDILECKVK